MTVEWKNAIEAFFHSIENAVEAFLGIIYAIKITKMTIQCHRIRQLEIYINLNIQKYLQTGQIYSSYQIQKHSWYIVEARVMFFFFSMQITFLI